MVRRLFLFFALMVTLGGLGCVANTGDGGDEIPDLLVGGKADNYYSDVSFEFEVEGKVPLELTPEQYADEAYRTDYVARRLTAVGLYLTTYVTDKFRGIDSNGNGEIDPDEVFFHNVDYGGFHAMVRNYTVEPVEVAGDAETGYELSFRIDMAGPKTLLEIIPRLEDTEIRNGVAHFSFQMPEGAAVEPEGVPRRDIRRFNPVGHEGELETIACQARRLPEPGNAYPDYQGFVAEDRTYDITLFYGHDYNESRSDLKEAEEAFDTLISLGFDKPAEVSDFDSLGRDSGPFTRKITMGGTEVDAMVRIFHSEMFTDDRSGQHDRALSELVSRDVFFYNGHAGPYYGFYLDEAGAAKVDYLEFAEANFEADRQQLFIAQGCQTYSQYADMMYANSNKNEDNLDVVVTVNYSYGEGTMTILRNLLRMDTEDRHVPMDFYRIVGDLNSNWINRRKDVFYGVTGIDGNPQLHPYGNLTPPETCTRARDCGDPTGNRCVNMGGERTCGVVTLSGEACPDGSTFGSIDEGIGDSVGVCTSLRRDEPVGPIGPIDPLPGTNTPDHEGALVLTEVMINPDARSDAEGEWVELWNPSVDTAYNLAGCRLGDNAGHGYMIGNLIVGPGGYAVFARAAEPGFEPSGVYGSALQLSNKKDRLVLTCGDSTVIDAFEYTGRVRAGRALSLRPEASNAALNDDRGNWCNATVEYAVNEAGRKDHGTPGSPNPACE